MGTGGLALEFGLLATAGAAALQERTGSLFLRRNSRSKERTSVPSGDLGQRFVAGVATEVKAK